MTLYSEISAGADYSALDDFTKRLVMASWESADVLEEELAPYPDPAESTGDAKLGAPGETQSPQTAGTPQGVWLSSLAVEGFRGIGSRTELLLNPGPGLTLVVGRNGSGKSSFAEGLEALLTGDSLRWRDRPSAWRDGWRNLHHEGSVSVSAEFHREGDEVQTAVHRRWAESFDDSTADCSIGDKRIEFDWLGWTESLVTFKPLLSYNELGSMLEQKPSAIYDSMATVLGLERLTEARERLRQARLDAEKPGKEFKKQTDELRGLLEGSGDPRAAEAVSLIAARNTDLDALRRLSNGAGGPEGAGLKSLASLEPIDAERCHDAAAELATAMARLDELGATDAGRSRRLAGLLRTALEHHEIDATVAGGHSAMTCPVCGEGSLDQAWRARASDEVEQLDAEASAADDAATAVTRARHAAISALVGPPSAVERETVAADLAEQWTAWVFPPADGWTEAALIERLGWVGQLNDRIGQVVADAQSELARSDEAWRPYGERIVAWVQQSESVARSNERAKQLKVGEDFYKKTEARLRTERFQPIAERAGELWSMLRQQSNVTLERVALEGTTTQRRVALDVTVDGTDTSALGVMSQGELHALALALFLPRVTSIDSPFRFVLIDDPVQAMDAARVDGLARVLEQVATDRQVVVFTHDDRLPASCRRLGVKADVVRVQRRSGSRVTTTMGQSPALDAIGNAHTLAMTSTIPDDLKRAIVPMHCRMALDAQLRDLVWGRLLLAGRSHEEIERLLDEANRTSDLLALWLLGREADPDDAYDALDQLRSGSSGRVKFLQKAVHDPPLDLNPEALTGTIRSLIRDLAQL